MKPRVLIALALAALAAGGVAWWIMQSSATETKTARADVTPNATSVEELSFASRGPVVSSGMAPPPASLIVTTPGDSEASAPAAPAPGLHFAAGPSDGAERALAAIVRRANSFPLRQIVEQGVNLDLLTVRAPIANYRGVSRAALLDGTGFADAYLFGYEYYAVEAGGRPVARAIGWVDDNGSTQLTAVGLAGPASEDMVRALGQFANDARMSGAAYEVRMVELEAGALGGSGRYSVLWLQSQSGGPDFVYPTFVPNEIPPGTLYTMGEFLELVRPIAQELEANPRPQGALRTPPDGERPTRGPRRGAP